MVIQVNDGNHWVAVDEAMTLANGEIYIPGLLQGSYTLQESEAVDGYELDNAFDKETLEYSVTVKEGTESIKVNAQLADSSAKVIGVGEVTVSEGINKFEIVVTAQKGNQKKYIINIRS